MEFTSLISNKTNILLICRNCWHELTHFQKVVDIFDIIERIVDDEIEFRYGPHLIMDPVAKFEPYFFLMSLYMLQKLLLFVFAKKAEINFSKKKIGRNVHFGNGNHISREVVPAHGLEYFT